MHLVIVESPTKAKTLSRFLKDKPYEIESTLGHIRDLPEHKLGVDLDGDFKPDYRVNMKKKDAIEKIKSKAKKASSIILATDSDREGEAISYHTAQILGFIDETWPRSTLKKSNSLSRIVFHEITKDAIDDALKNPKSINFDLVDAQQARRILDRLVGYKLSPLLWSKMGKKWLSAGRVQTVVLRFIVEREREIEKFKVEPFFKVTGFFTNGQRLEAQLISKDDVPYEKRYSIELFDGTYTYTKTTITGEDIPSLKSDISKDTYRIDDVVAREIVRHPPPPFTTSALQQAGAQKLGYSSRITMRLAQNLYEKGFITYHRTDSVSIAGKFQSEARAHIKQVFGDNYLPPKPRFYKTKSRLAQEAHEAIRPTNLSKDIAKAKGITAGHKKLYELIKNQALASQMQDARIKVVKVHIRGQKGYLFVARFETVMFDGFLRVLSAKSLRRDRIGVYKKDQKVKLEKVDFSEHVTSPPPRYNEASLIRTLDKRGIGRPSTYAPIISIIQDRNYVEKKIGIFYPTILGSAVSDYLSKAFADIFKVDFTAQMEDDLDGIAEGRRKMIAVIGSFWGPLQKHLARERKKKGHIDVEEKIDEKCPRCQHQLVIRYSKYGKFIACSNFPKCKFTKNFEEKVDRKCPKCGGDIIVRFTRRRRRFYGCSNYPKCDFAAWRLNQIPKKEI